MEGDSFLTDGSSPSMRTKTDEPVRVCLSDAGSPMEARVGRTNLPLTQRSSEPRWTVTEPGGSCGVLVADSIVVTRESRTHRRVALYDILTSHSLAKQGQLGLVQQEAEDAAPEAVGGDGEVSVVELEHIMRSPTQVEVLW